MSMILEKASEQGLPLTAEDLIGSPSDADQLPQRKRRAS